MARSQAAGSLTSPRDPVTDCPEETRIVSPRRTAPWPSVTVIVPTRDRPVMVARAVRSIIGQSYPGEIECVIVFDQSDPAEVNVELSPGRQVRILTNTRTPGAAGARNTGIIASDGPFVAFCDDDDTWDADKLRLQVELLDVAPFGFVACGMRVHYADRVIARPAPGSVSLQQLVRKRHPELGVPTFLLRRDALTEIGLLDEQVPGSSGEDYDFLLRSARRGPIDAVSLRHLSTCSGISSRTSPSIGRQLPIATNTCLASIRSWPQTRGEGHESRARSRSPTPPSHIGRPLGGPVSGRCVATH